MITVGIDIGSITTKIAMVGEGRILYTDIMLSGYDMEQAWRNLFACMLERTQTKASDIGCIVSTGYGRNIVAESDKKITEITCHAAGARHFFPNARSVVDIGGQDSKFISIDSDGSVADFIMNDKCAAGTGRFLEVMARALHVELKDFGEMTRRAQKPALISSMCTVFAESEVISMIAKGDTRENIIAGIHESVASRVASMMRRLDVVKPLVMTGGVTRNAGIRDALEKKIGMKLEIPEQAQACGAIGAALLGSGK